MNNGVPFSSIDQFLVDKKIAPYALCDTSFLVAMSDEDHLFHEEAQFLVEKLAEYDFKLFVSVTARSEFIDYHRRVKVTETLMGILAPSSKWKITQAVRDGLKKQRGWIDDQIGRGFEGILTDSRIKDCKQIFLPVTQSGKIGWIELCKEMLGGQLLGVWNQISDLLKLNYVDMRSNDVQNLFRKDLHWENMYRLAEESALGSQDAMILNLFEASIFPVLITMDFDLAYGVMLNAKDKNVLVPDNLFRNRLKKLKFT